MKLKAIGQKIKQTNYKKLFGTKTFLIVCCVVLAAASLVVATLIDGGNAKTVADESGSKLLGNTVLVDNEVSTDALLDAIADGEDYFAVSTINRQKTRDEALELLRGIADDPETMPDAAAEALAEISGIAVAMEAENDIETLVKAKGFEECVAVISDGGCTVIVKSDGLIAEQVAQILEIAMTNSGLPASKIKVVEK